MVVPRENKTSNSYIRERLPLNRTASTASLLRFRHASNYTLDKLVELCAGSSSKGRIERIQEIRIIKSLPSTRNEQFEAAVRSIMDKITELARKFKALPIGSQDRVEVRREIDALVDRLIDNPHQVSVPGCPDTLWADMAGGSITGIREAGNSRTPWKEPNFGITFRYRVPEEQSERPKQPELQGNGSLYGDQWQHIEREVSFSRYYDPTPYDPDPSLQDLPSPARSTNSASSEALQMKHGYTPTNSISHKDAQGEFSDRSRRKTGSFSSVVSDLNDCLTKGISDKELGPSQRISTIVKMSGHTIPPSQFQGNHLNCFPDIARPQPKRPSLNLERACAQYKAYDENSEAIPKAEAAAKFRTAPSESNVHSEGDEAEIPAWKLTHDKVEAKNTEDRAKDYLTSTSSRTEMRNYKTTRMLEEQHRLSEEQREKIQAQDAQAALEVQEEKMRKIAEKQKIIDDARLAQEHRDRAFKSVPSRSIISARVEALGKAVPDMDGAIQALAVAQAQAAMTKKSAPGSRVDSHVHFRERETKRRGPIYKNAEALAAARRAMKRAEEDESDESDTFYESRTTTIVQDTASTAKDSTGMMKDAAETLEDTTNITTPKDEPGIDKPKTVSEGAGQPTEQEPASATNIQPPAEVPSMPIPIPIPGSMGQRCAIDDTDSDDDDDSWDPKWIIDRKPIQYSLGGTRMYTE